MYVPSTYITRLLTHSLTPHSTVLLEKLTGLQLVKKFPAFYGTRMFITAFTSAAICLYPEPDQSSPYPHTPLHEHPFYAWVSLMVPFLQVFPPNPYTCLSPPAYALHGSPNSSTYSTKFKRKQCLIPQKKKGAKIFN
jgi:hypothetical protein